MCNSKNKIRRINTMQLVKVITYLLLGITRANDTYYKLVSIAGKKGCVEAPVSPTVATRFGALYGTCLTQNCTTFTGSRYIPFCCVVKGYKCHE